MPLLTSPIDGSPMRQINRYGIEIDICPTSGGIWMDKGELEKLMAIIQEESRLHEPLERQQARPQYYRPHYNDDDDHHYHKDYKYRGKKSKFSRIADIFDF